MVLKISSSVFKQLNEGILLFNRTATVVYPSQKEKCPNCYQNTMGGRSVNFYKPDGPVPFSRGVLCPVCGGEGFRSIEGKDSVELRIYYNKREFVNVGFDVDVPNNVIQTIGYMDDYDLIIKVDIREYQNLIPKALNKTLLSILCFFGKGCNGIY